MTEKIHGKGGAYETKRHHRWTRGKKTNKEVTRKGFAQKEKKIKQRLSSLNRENSP